ncbi:uncharacterized protein L201_000280 [Kwoniella dendrophila CBS 6074]|uniref:Uncharacterized protein n=1 Tax=Kwoniella dendrophila CBS 6074 TaxID=1295534 RepID=A0AAX4JIZ2_9TREE
MTNDTTGRNSSSTRDTQVVSPRDLFARRKESFFDNTNSQGPSIIARMFSQPPTSTLKTSDSANSTAVGNTSQGEEEEEK